MDSFVSGDWAPAANTLLLIILAVLNYAFHRKGKADRAVLATELEKDKVQVAGQLQDIASAIADTRRIAKESHNDLVQVAKETTNKILSERRYSDHPGPDHTFNPVENQE